MARSHPWPSDEDLAYTMTSATSKCTGKIMTRRAYLLKLKE